jgi:hypothetical protein
MLAVAPGVQDYVLDIGHPPPTVVTQAPGVLNARPPLTIVFDLNSTGRLEAAFLEESDCGKHGHGLPSYGAGLVHTFE